MRLYTLLLAAILAAACMAVPFRISRVYPAVLRRIPQYDDSVAQKQREGENEAGFNCKAFYLAKGRTSTWYFPYFLYDEVLLMIPRYRQRRSQPIIDYTDEFSADPFEVPENAAEQRPKNLAVLDLF